MKFYKIDVLQDKSMENLTNEKIFLSAQGDFIRDKNLKLYIYIYIHALYLIDNARLLM